MATRNRGLCKAALRGLDGPRPLPLALAFLGFLFVAPMLFADAYVVKLKDGSLVFARAPHVIRGTRAIITLENGIITQIPIDEVDQPGTEKYNRENFGNAIAIPTPRENALALPVRLPQSRSVSAQSADSVLSGGPVVRSARRPLRREARHSASQQ